MANLLQFGNAEPQDTRPAACQVCEAMCPDAVDGTLSAAEQRAFEQHVAGCVACAQELAEAQRGAAWLAMLKAQRPEPPVNLLAKILAETSGAAAGESVASPLVNVGTVDERATQRGLATPAFVVPAVEAAKTGKVLMFRQKVAAVFAMDASRTSFHPRLAMTAAMAFFSIALTLNLTGVRLHDMRAENFTPGGLQRTVADVSTSVTRSFQNSRMVYQMESRVSDLRSDGVLGAEPAPR